MTTHGKMGRTRHNVKTLSGRGLKRAEWVKALHEDLVNEFEIAPAASVKISPSVLKQIAISLIPRAPLRSSYAATVQLNNIPIVNKITSGWIQVFMDSHDTVIRRETGKLSVNTEKQLHIQKSEAFNLGTLRRGFENWELHEDLIENADATHFVFNMDNGRTVGMRGDEKGEYADIVVGDEGVTMMVCITGGRNAHIEPYMLVFKNQNTLLRVFLMHFRAFDTDRDRRGGWIIESLRSDCPNRELSGGDIMESAVLFL